MRCVSCSTWPTSRRISDDPDTPRTPRRGGHALRAGDRGMSDGGVRVVLDPEEARRVANSLEMLYYDTEASAYDATDEQAARDAMTIRERGEIEPNPELIDDE